MDDGGEEWRHAVRPLAGRRVIAPAHFMVQMHGWRFGRTASPLIIATYRSQMERFREHLLAKAKHARLLLCGALVLVGLAACLRGGRELSRERSAAVLYIENRDSKDVTIFALSGSQRVRIGLVPGLSSASFKLPSAALERVGGSIRLQADPVGTSLRLTSEAIAVRAGNRVEWTLDPGLRRGALAVYD